MNVHSLLTIVATLALALPAQADDEGIALTIYLSWTVARLTGDRERAAWIAVAYWANPATILNGEVLGYLDPLMMLPTIASLVLLHLRAPEWAGASLAIAMLDRGFPVFPPGNT